MKREERSDRAPARFADGAQKKKAAGLSIAALTLTVMLALFSPAAEAAEWSRPVVSAGYDLSRDRPLRPLQSAGNDREALWASAWLREADEDTEVTVTWSYIDPKDGKSVLYKERLYVNGTKPVVSKLDQSKAEYFPATEYVVDFRTADGLKTEARFRLVPGTDSRTEGNSPKKPRALRESSPDDDQTLIASLSKKYPGVRHRVKSLELYRTDSPDGTFDLILPTGWKRYAEPSPAVFHFVEPGAQKPRSHLLIIRKRFDPETVRKKTPEKIILDSFGFFASEEEQNNGKFEIQKLSQMTIGTFFAEKKGKNGILKTYYALQLERNGTLYVIIAAVPPSKNDLGRFLSSVCLFSLRSDPDAPAAESGEARAGAEAESSPSRTTASLRKNGKKAPSRSCSPPERRRDRTMVRAILSRFPKAYEKLRRLALARYTDPAMRFSLIVPSHWSRQLDSDRETPLLLSTKAGGHEYQYTVKILPAEKEKLRKVPPGELIKAVGESILETVRETSRKNRVRFEIVNPLTIRASGKHAYAYMLLKYGKPGNWAWMGYVIRYDGRNVFLLNIVTDDPQREVVQFIQSLGLNGFWSPERCKSH